MCNAEPVMMIAVITGKTWKIELWFVRFICNPEIIKKCHFGIR